MPTALPERFSSVSPENSMSLKAYAFADELPENTSQIESPNPLQCHCPRAADIRDSQADIA